MTKKILCVDDEPNVLMGYKRMLRKDFDISTAEGGAEALEIIANEGPFAVVVSDMRMPQMDGVEFLRRVREIAPDTVRIMLTGNSDQQTATNAVNEGSIFRFLTKPCSTELLAKTLDAGLEQHRLITAEKLLLEETLSQSLQVLVDMLSMVNPTAFNRSKRIKNLTRQVAEALNVENLWAVEIAAMLSQVGCITVPEEILYKIAHGISLNNKEAALYYQHPQTGSDLIGRIPRMEIAAKIIANQNRRINDEALPNLKTPDVDEATFGARILKIVLDYDKMIMTGNSPSSAFKEMSGRVGWYDLNILNVLNGFIKLDTDEYITTEISIPQLKPGMILDQDLMSKRGSMFVPAGQEVNATLIFRLMNFANAEIIANQVQVRVPVKQAQTISA